MKKRFFFISVIAILLFIGFYFYLNKVLLPVKLKGILLKNIEEITQRKAELDSLRYNIFKGVEIKGLTIFENPAFKGAPFLRVKELDLTFLFLPLLKEKKIIVTSLTLDSPEINLIRDKGGLWNFSDLLNLKLPVDKNGQKFSLLVYKIGLLRAKCRLEDRSLRENFSKELGDFNCRVNFALPSQMKFTLEGKIPNKDSFTPISVKGNLDLTNLKVAGSLLTKNIDSTEYLPYLAYLPFIIKAGKINTAKVNLAYQDNKYDIDAQLEAFGIDIASGDYEIRGNPFIKAKMIYALNATEKIDYSAEIIPNGLNIDGIAYLKTLDKISGKILVSPDLIQFSNIQGNSAGTQVNISGNLQNFTSPLINLKVTADVEVSRLKEIFKEELRGIPVTIEGRTLLDIQLTGTLNKIPGLNLAGKAAFSNLQAKVPSLAKEIKNIAGQVNFDLNSLRWTGLKGEYLGEEYSSSGSLKNFASPSIEAELKSRLFSISTQFDLAKDKISLDTLEGNVLNSSLKLSGEFDIQDRENPLANLSLELNVDLKDLKEALPQFKNSLEKINGEGLVLITGNCRGRFKDKSSWQGNLNGQSPQLFIFGLRLTNLMLNFLQRPNLNGNLELAGNLYGGQIGVSGELGPLLDKIPFDLRARIEKLDLSKLKLDTPFKDKPASGMVNAMVSLSGLAQNQASWQGRSSISLKEGNLWEFSLLKGLGKLLLIPEFEKIVINEAQGDFSIANKNIYIENLELKSNEMIIDADGSADFSGNLNLRLLTQFSEQLVKSSESLKKFITNILTSASAVLTIKVTGTFEHPKYTVVPVVKDIIKNLPGIIFDNILK